jgi:inner membrane protein involved in colicin E2 resistance
MSEDKKNKFALLVINIGDFTGIGSGQGVKFPSDQVKTIKDTLDADGELSLKSDQCISILPLSD